MCDTDWESCGQKRLIVDVYIPSTKTIVEYNGPHHYGIKTNYAYKEERLAQIQRRDEYLRKWCEANGLRLVEIDGRKYTSPNAIESYLKEELGFST